MPDIEFLVYTKLAWFYGISNIVDYLMPKPVYTYIYIYILDNAKLFEWIQYSSIW